jgi:hypothetical protein
MSDRTRNTGYSVKCDNCPRCESRPRPEFLVPAGGKPMREFWCGDRWLGFMAMSSVKECRTGGLRQFELF